MALTEEEYVIMGDELTNDPLGRGYAALNDTEASDDLNEIRPGENEIEPVVADQAKPLVLIGLRHLVLCTGR